MHDRDCLHRVVGEHYPIRGQRVHLDAAWRAVLEHADYPDSVTRTRGEAVVASELLAATLKFDGMRSLQLLGDGPGHLLIAQCSSTLAVRALARHSAAPHSAALGDMAGQGNLTVTIETGEVGQRYQGIVPLAGERLADCLQVYFDQSEQLPTRLWLQADERGASGMLLQRLPDDGTRDEAGTNLMESIDAARIDDAWRRVQLIGDTLKQQELARLRDRDILRRLFNEDDVRLFEANPVSFRCKCSRERVTGVLQSLGEGEIRDVLAERGDVEVRCDFCNRAYVFDAVDVERVFTPGAHRGGAGTVH
jgi:molecular chaperone Hsp33